MSSRISTEERRPAELRRWAEQGSYLIGYPGKHKYDQPLIPSVYPELKPGDWLVKYRGVGRDIFAEYYMIIDKTKGKYNTEFNFQHWNVYVQAYRYDKNTIRNERELTRLHLDGGALANKKAGLRFELYITEEDFGKD